MDPGSKQGSPRGCLPPQGGLPCVLDGHEDVPLHRDSLLGDAEVHAIHGHHAVIDHVVRAQPALKDDLRLRGGGGGGVRTGMEKKVIFLPCILLRCLTTLDPCEDILSFSVRPLNHKALLQKTPQSAPSSHCDYSPPR